MDVDSHDHSGIYQHYQGLQWSHVLMDVDSTNAATSVAGATSASMEPRPDGRG